MNKVKRDGMVAVLYSPGFGAGWSTWASSEDASVLCMDERIVQPFLDGGAPAAVKAALQIYPDLYTGGGRDLKVEWVKEGAVFEIEEYDGSESLHIIGDRQYMTA